MPEGPEVRRHADTLAGVLAGETIVEVAARTKLAKQWLQDNPEVLVGKQIERVRAHGKNLIVSLEDDFFLYSHLMMWGRWQVFPAQPPPERDRRERARIATKNAVAILMSAPIFLIGRGDPYQQIENLGALGPDVLPYPDEGPFDESEFRARLGKSEYSQTEIGAALLDQTICAGIGNYLRAEILFSCRMNPWRSVESLSKTELNALCRAIPNLCLRAYENGGATADDDARTRLRSDETLVYRPGAEWHTRHMVFRRTNLPCLACGEKIRQKRQTTRVIDAEEKTRIIYFCAHCQSVPEAVWKPKKAAKPRAKKPADAQSATPEKPAKNRATKAASTRKRNSEA